MRTKSRLDVERTFYNLTQYGLLDVTEDGRVFDAVSGKELGVKKSDNRYRLVKYKLGRKTLLILLHRLVWIAFRGVPKNSSLVVNHINGLKGDSSIGNLELITSSANSLHAYALGLRKPNTEKAVASLRVFTEVEVRKFRRLHSAGKCTQREIAEAKNLNISTVSNMLLRKSYAWVD